jgi:hypothetical protein
MPRSESRRRGQDRERDVGCARVEVLVELVVAPVLEDLHPRVLQLTQQGRQDADGDAREGRDADARAGRLESAVEVVVGPLDLLEQRPAVLEERLAGRGRLHRPAAAGVADQELAVDDPLQGGHLLADARLRIAELAGGRGEGAFLDDGHEGGDQTDLQRRPALGSRHGPKW